MKLEDIKKGSTGKRLPEMAFASVRLPKETYDYIKANNISLRKLVVVVVEELKELCQICHKEKATEGNYCLACAKIAEEATQQDYFEEKVKDGKEAIQLNDGKEEVNESG